MLASMRTPPSSTPACAAQSVKLLFSTHDLEIGGRSIEGFPLLINDDCLPLDSAVENCAW
ncbi:MAG: hypothetical protein Q7K57_29710 [Burkholderiaceae bacterium]|nr:hypothetical protein [Burkholderiaceae bacterium]